MTQINRRLDRYGLLDADYTSAQEWVGLCPDTLLEAARLRVLRAGRLMYIKVLRALAYHNRTKPDALTEDKKWRNRKFWLS